MVGGTTPAPEDVQATFCATLVDEWARAGITDACVAPGSRSTPIALALAADRRLGVHVFHDERAASFAALGLGLATDRPAIVVTTSGTAATHVHGAVVEADLASVPLIACTADRPPELWDIGAPQTIDQRHLYSSAVRFYAEPGVPDDTASATWRSLAARTALEATGATQRPGPVHLNLSFRDPLVGEPGPLPPGRTGGGPWHRLIGPTPIDAGPELESVEQPATGPSPLAGTGIELSRAGVAVPGVILAGAGTPDPETVVALSERLGWPILADHRSGCRAAPCAVTHFDAMLRSELFTDRTPAEVVVRFGEALASKVVGQWLSRSSAAVVAVTAGTRWSDPERIVAAHLAGRDAPVRLLSSLPTELEPSTAAELWLDADRRAAAAVDATLDGAGPAPSEIELARRVVQGVPAGGALVVSSSMPVRDVEWFAPARPDIDIYANRGANGIDGVVSTAVGVALSGRPTAALVGDVAFLHDSTALIALADRPVDLEVVVVDNDGGGIFSFLPQAHQLPPETYELLFGTPHGTDLALLAAAHGLPCRSWPERGSGSTDDGPRVTIARSERQANALLHDEVNRAVVKAIEA